MTRILAGMTTQDTALVALGALGVFFLLAFGVRSIVHYRRTGATGYVGLSGAPGSVEWWGGLLFALALLAAVAAPLLQYAGVVQPAAMLAHPSVRAIGALLYLAGATGTLWAQFAMGESWRIGVDAGERTALVASGPFRWVRNPIFTAMSAATIGIALLVPNVVALAGVVALLAALEIQVRLVEEPYLAHAHGDAYRRYAASAGRFLPGFGRLRG